MTITITLTAEQLASIAAQLNQPPPDPTPAPTPPVTPPVTPPPASGAPIVDLSAWGRRVVDADVVRIPGNPDGHKTIIAMNNTQLVCVPFLLPRPYRLLSFSMNGAYAANQPLDWAISPARGDFDQHTIGRSSRAVPSATIRMSTDGSNGITIQNDRQCWLNLRAAGALTRTQATACDLTFYAFYSS